MSSGILSIYMLVNTWFIGVEILIHSKGRHQRTVGEDIELHALCIPECIRLIEEMLVFYEGDGVTALTGSSAFRGSSLDGRAFRIRTRARGGTLLEGVAVTPIGATIFSSSCDADGLFIKEEKNLIQRQRPMLYKHRLHYNHFYSWAMRRRTYPQPVQQLRRSKEERRSFFSPLEPMHKLEVNREEQNVPIGSDFGGWDSPAGATRWMIAWRLTHTNSSGLGSHGWMCILAYEHNHRNQCEKYQAVLASKDSGIAVKKDLFLIVSSLVSDLTDPKKWRSLSGF